MTLVAMMDVSLMDAQARAMMPVIANTLAHRQYCSIAAGGPMKVKECMTKEVVTVKPELSAKEAFGLIKSLGVRHLVVVKEGVVLGIVTDRDLRRPQAADLFKSWDELYRLSDEFQVEDVMTSPVLTIDANADVQEAAGLMVKRRIGALPVTDAHHGLAGIITETDLLKALIAS